MSVLNAILRGLFDGLLLPFRGLHPLVGLTVLSVPVSVGMLLAFKAASDQERLAAIKRQIHAGLFEIRLFNDDLRAIFRALGEILGQNLRYLGHSLRPLVWLIVPFGLLIGQLQYRYGYTGLTPGQAAIVKVQLGEGWETGARDAPSEAERPPVELQVPQGVRVETPALWAPSAGELAWRIVPEKSGSYELVVKVEGHSFTKAVEVSSRVVRRSPVRPAARLLEELRYPAEPPLPEDAPLESIEVTYPEAGPVFLELTVWVWVFFLLTIVLAFALRGRFGVTI